MLQLKDAVCIAGVKSASLNVRLAMVVMQPVAHQVTFYKIKMSTRWHCECCGLQRAAIWPWQQFHIDAIDDS